MLKYAMLGILLIALTGTGAKAMSILPFGGGKAVNTVPMKEEKSERNIRCKGEVEIDDRGRVVKCSEGFYLAEESENMEERKATLKEKFIGWLSNFKGMLFWAVIASIVATLLGFGGVVGSVWGNLFSGTAKAAKAMIKGITNFKRNGKKLSGKDKERYDAIVKELISELEREQLKLGVQKKVDKLRAKVDK